MQFGARVVCAMAVLGMSMGLVPTAQGASLTVKTAQGKVRGKTIHEGRVRAFLGIPYAAPPVGELRWRAPQPAGAWKGVREATRYGAHCYQGHVYDDMIFQDDGPSEDCLYLNVFTPAKARPNSKLPVMFWIHGGGYSGGSASEPRHDGDYLPTRGVVLVTINYRLGVLGFLATKELAEENNGSAGNYGLMDMVAALHWVHNNIARFGGDPDNVTIFGESAGSFAVSTLMAAEPARGLFAKAIGESGGALNVGAPGSATLAETEAKDSAWAASLGAKTLAELRAMPAETLIEAGRKKGAMRFSPVIDGAFLTEPVAETYSAGRQAHVPLLAGWNRDENAGLARGMTVEKWKAFAADHFGEQAAEFLRLFPGETDEQAQRSAIDYGSAAFIAFGTWRWIEAQRETGDAPVYRYHFELAAPPSKYHPGWFAFHSDDIEYVFGTLDTRPGAEWRPEDRKLSEEMMGYWTNFARSGDPNGQGLPEWPRYDKTGEIVHLDSAITAGDAAKTQERYEFLRKWMSGGSR